MIRNEIRLFAEEMEKIMSKHDKNKGDSWKTVSIEYLEKKRVEEHREYNHSGNPSELIDEANILMMLWSRRTNSANIR